MVLTLLNGEINFFIFEKTYVLEKNLCRTSKEKLCSIHIKNILIKKQKNNQITSQSS